MVPLLQLASDELCSFLPLLHIQLALEPDGVERALLPLDLLDQCPHHGRLDVVFEGDLFGLDFFLDHSSGDVFELSSLKRAAAALCSCGTNVPVLEAQLQVFVLVTALVLLAPSAQLGHVEVASLLVTVGIATKFAFESVCLLSELLAKSRS